MKLSILGYKTAFACISNELNNLPICLGTRYVGLGDLDLITPARLLFGRASNRSMVGFCKLEGPTRMLEQMEQVFQAWWKAWYEQKVVDWIPQPRKWNRSNEAVKVGDIVILPRVGGEQVLGQPVWRIGRIKAVEKSEQDGRVRKVEVEYKNVGESRFRVTRRSVRGLAVLHREGELELFEQLNQAARESDKKFHVMCYRRGVLDFAESS